MNCGEARSKLQSYLDRDLPVSAQVELESHLKSCSSCSAVFEEFSFLLKAMALRPRLQPTAERYLRESIRQKTQPRPRMSLKLRFRAFLYRLREIDKRLLGARVSAVPLTLVIFYGLIALPQNHYMSFTAQAIDFDPKGLAFQRPMISIVSGRQDPRETNRLMRTAASIPYEDQMAVVTEIDPGGRVEIDRVLEYPKSDRLLEAIGDSLRSTRFEPQSDGASKKMVQLFHKIDVYDDNVQRGM